MGVDGRRSAAYEDTVRTTKKRPLSPTFHVETNILPSQAQDKHRHSSPKKCRFLQEWEWAALQADGAVGEVKVHEDVLNTVGGRGKL